jgi:hypothetical protein
MAGRGASLSPNEQFVHQFWSLILDQPTHRIGNGFDALERDDVSKKNLR